MARVHPDWWFWFLIMTTAILLLSALTGCEDTTSPDVGYLSAPIIRPMGNHRLDYWDIGADGFASHAAFGWTAALEYESTEDAFTEPGIHIEFSVGGRQVLWGPKLPLFLRASGHAGEDSDTVTGISNNEGVATFAAGLREWPGNAHVRDNLVLQWHGCGMDEKNDAMTEASFSQEFGYRFDGEKGAFAQSWQGAVYGAKSFGATFRIMPGINNPLPKVAVADIPPTAGECADSLGNPPYSDSAADGGDILIRAHWNKVRAADGLWVVQPSRTITPLPYDANDVGSIVDTAWPYTVSFHAPAESAGLGMVEATLSIIDPNQSPTAEVGINVYEVGRCKSCDQWIWRSDYVLVLAGPPHRSGLSKASSSGRDVVVCWLPHGHKMRVDPILSTALLVELSAHWLAHGGPFDRNRDGVVNFTDYAILLTWGD